jgi:PhoH-like ATPase
MGKDIGFLPSDIQEKLTPWMQPIYDNFDLIFGSQAPKAKHIIHAYARRDMKT